MRQRHQLFNFFHIFLEEGNRIELSPVSQWDGFQDRVRAMQPTFLIQLEELPTTPCDLRLLPKYGVYSALLIGLFLVQLVSIYQVPLL